MSVLNGYCPSCGESVAIDVFLTGMEHEVERLANGKYRSFVHPTVSSPSVAHDCRVEEPA